VCHSEAQAVHVVQLSHDHCFWWFFGGGFFLGGGGGGGLLFLFSQKHSV